jgi:hypothetical protein
MKTAIRAVLLGLAAVVAGCASTEERDQREDIHNTMRRDAAICGTDAACLQKRAEEREHGSHTGR